MNFQNKKNIYKNFLIIIALAALIIFLKNKYTVFTHVAPTIDKSIELKLGNKAFSLDAPKKGSVYLCEANYFKSGASRVGEWIDEAKGVWYPLSKISVEGAVSWDTASSSFLVNEDKRIIYTNALPTTHTTGIFPIQKNDPAYFYDKNPFPIKMQNVNVAVPKNPQIAEEPSCLPWGPLGYSITGIPFEHPLDTMERDAPAYEIQDVCRGHPQPINGGLYHYHDLPPDECLGNKVSSTSPVLVGYALDGFGIYKEYRDGKMLTSEDLDECHGTISKVLWDGVEQEIYHYVATKEFPYLLSCFKGKVDIKYSNLPSGR